MYGNSAFTLYKSPKITFDQFELSPLQTSSKFQMTNRKSTKEGEEEIHQKSVNNFDIDKLHDESKNKSTPYFKIPIYSEKNFREIIDLKGNIIINQDDEEKEESFNQIRKFSSSLRNPKLENPIENSKINKGKIISNFFPNQAVPNVTNIIINYQTNNYPVLEKHIKDPSDFDISKSKMRFKLNEILINGKKIEHLINLNSDESHYIEVCFPLYENNFFKLNKKIMQANKTKRNSKYFNNLLHLVKDADYINQLIATQRFKEIFYAKFEKYSQVPIDPLFAYKKHISEFKKRFLAFQMDFNSKNNKRPNDYLLSKVEDAIDDLNNLVDVIFECVNYIKRGKGIKKKKKKSDYVCDICDRIFSNAQSKGGHMSKMHPNESLKYKSKILVRDSRSKLREIVLKAKKELLANYNFNYDYLVESMKKNIISEILKKHKSEYTKIKKRLKSELMSNTENDF